MRRLSSKWIRRKWHFLNLSCYVIDKYFGNVGIFSDRLSPDFPVCFVFNFRLLLFAERNITRFLSSKSCRTRNSPSSIRELIPLLCLGDVTLLIFSPENRSHTLLNSTLISGFLERKLARLVDNSCTFYNLNDRGF